MISHTVKTQDAPYLESVSDTSPGKKHSKTNSPFTGSQKKLFLRTAPVSSLFRLKINRRNYASLQRLEHKDRLRRDCYQVSKSVICALKHPEIYEYPFHFSYYGETCDIYLSDCHGNIVEKLYISRENARIASRLININAGKRLIYSIMDFDKPSTIEVI